MSIYDEAAADHRAWLRDEYVPEDEYRPSDEDIAAMDTSAGLPSECPDCGGSLTFEGPSPETGFFGYAILCDECSWEHVEA